MACRWGLARLLATGLGVAMMVGSFAGCGPGPDENSGGDEQRATAAPVPFDQVVDDRVSPNDGDTTDWRVFRLEEPDKVNLALYWDNADIAARVELRNAFGNVVAKREHAEGEGVDRITAELEKGEYYLSVVAEEGSSVYSLEITLGEPVAGGGPRKPKVTDPRPE